MLYSSTYRKEENESIFPEFYVQEKTSEFEFWSLALSFGFISNFQCFKSNFPQKTLGRFAVKTGGKAMEKCYTESTYRIEENESIFPEFYVQEKTSEIEFWSLALSFGCISVETQICTFLRGNNFTLSWDAIIVPTVGMDKSISYLTLQVFSIWHFPNSTTYGYNYVYAWKTALWYKHTALNSFCVSWK